MGSSLSAEQPEVAPTGVRMNQQEQVIKMSVSSVAGLMNHVDDRLKKLERGLSKHADNTEIIAASLSKITLLEDTLTELSTQITNLESKLESVCKSR